MIKRGLEAMVEPVELPISDREFKADPHAFYAALRKSGAVARARLPSGLCVWVVTGYDAARALLSDKRLSKVQPEDCTGNAQRLFDHPLFNHLLKMDPPLHTRIRSVIAPQFSPRAMAALQPRIERLADELLDAIQSQREIDVLAQFAVPFAFSVVCEFVGIAHGERESLATLLQDLERAEIEAPTHVPSIAQRVFVLLEEASRTRSARSNGVTLLDTLTRARERSLIASEQVPALAFLVVAAGRETTANFVANSVFRLLAVPTSWSAFCRDRGDVQRWLDEMLRLESPLDVATSRYAVADIEVGEVTIRAGEMVFVGIAAANRDPQEFTAPDLLDLARPAEKKHLAFGRGPHACIGAALAVVEGRVALQRLAARYPDMRLAIEAAEYTWKLGLITRGLERLPVLLASSDSK